MTKKIADAAPDAAEVVEVEAGVVAGWLKSKQAILIDVRESQEYEFEHVPGSLLHPLSFLDPDVFPEIPEKRLVFICAVGKRSKAACLQLQKSGFTNLVNLRGGIEAWREAGLDLEGARFDAHDYVI
jgi:rhodanese-related sulfurtransferase